jgi:hypothetical protein
MAHSLTWMTVSLLKGDYFIEASLITNPSTKNNLTPSTSHSPTSLSYFSFLHNTNHHLTYYVFFNHPSKIYRDFVLLMFILTQDLCAKCTNRYMPAVFPIRSLEARAASFAISIAIVPS